MVNADLITMEMLILYHDEIQKARNIIRDLIIYESDYNRIESDDITTLGNALTVLKRITDRKNKEIERIFNERNI